MRKAVFPGSFDPITLGHVDIITRAIPLFDEIIIAIGINAQKKHQFSLEERIAFIKDTFKGSSNIKVVSYEGLTGKFCQENNAQFIIRGLRNTTDFNYEQPVAQTNFKLTGVESIFLLSSPEVSNISSSIVRDILRNDGDISTLVPISVKNH